MTTKVIILCPDNSVHDVAVHIENKIGDDWVRNAPPLVVPPHEQSEPVYLTVTTRVVCEEVARGESARPEPKAS